MNDRKALQMLKAIAEQHADAAADIGSVSDYIWDCAVLVSEMESTLDLIVNMGAGAVVQERASKVKEKSRRLFVR